MARIIQSGVYRIDNLENGHFYVGSSVNIRSRWDKHRSDYRLGRLSGRSYLFNAWRLYGEKSFAFSIIEELPDPFNRKRADIDEAYEIDYRLRLLAREQHYIDTLNPDYNLCPTAGSRLGTKLSAEQIEGIRLRMLGNQYTKGRVWTAEEHEDRRALLSELREERGGFLYRHTEEHKRRAAEWMTGNEHFLGKTHSEETRQLLSLLKSGVPLSPEHAVKARENIDKANETNPANKPGWVPTHRIGTTHTAETKALMSAASKGHQRNTPEVIEKQKAAHKAHWDARRAAGTTGIKLSNEQIIEAFLSPLSGKALAEKWGIDRSTINKIRSRKLNPSVTEHLVSPERDGRGRAKE